jgi:hypothetical protein
MDIYFLFGRELLVFHISPCREKTSGATLDPNRTIPSSTVSRCRSIYDEFHS